MIMTYTNLVLFSGFGDSCYFLDFGTSYVALLMDLWYMYIGTLLF